MKAGISLFSGCPQADSNVAPAAPTLVSIMNSRRFIGSFRFELAEQIGSAMADIAIDADVLGAMAVYTPAHILIDLTPDLMHLTDLSVTCNAINISLYMGFVSEEDVGRLWYPVNPGPGRLFSALGIGGQFLDFRAISFDRLMAGHARRDIWYSGVRGLIGILMAEGTFQLRAFLFRDVYPVVVGNGLLGCVRSCNATQEQEAAE
jgi:hypothetical protein